jgi:hypothetical protein
MGRASRTGRRFGTVGVFVAIAAIAWLPGCQNTLKLYEGGTKPAEEVAVFVPVPHDLYFFHVFHVEIVSVDDHVVGLANRSVSVLPGSHRVKLRRGAGTGKKHEVEYTIDAKAGHVYEIDARDVESDPPGVEFWVVDAHDGSVVAGTKPPK